jgi:hypothetical protein
VSDFGLVLLGLGVFGFTTLPAWRKRVREVNSPAITTKVLGVPVMLFASDRHY